jgi:hypothetical protein
MKLLTFDIPTDPTLLPQWLEGHLMGLDLPQVVSELEVLGGQADGPALALDHVLGAQGEEVLELGLRSLSHEQLRQLMRQPRLLWQLQELVLQQGGDYWTTVPEDPKSKESRRGVWDAITASIAAQQRPTRSAPARRTFGFRQPWLWAGAGWLVAAASLFLALFVGLGRVRELESGLREQTAKTDELRKSLEDARAAAQLLELPERERIVVAFIDDTPEGDPGDLPE